jgi:organic radical activating enzyme
MPSIRYPVVRVYRTLKSNCPNIGTPAVFVRFADNSPQVDVDEFFEDFEDDKRPGAMTGREIGARIRVLAGGSISLVVLKGGEPLSHEIGPIVEDLIDAGFVVQVETGGGAWTRLPVDSAFLSIVVLPDSDEVDRRVWNAARAFKYSVSMEHDLDIDGVPFGLAKPREGVSVFLEPKSGAARVANFEFARMACLHFGYRLSVSMDLMGGD